MLSARATRAPSPSTLSSRVSITAWPVRSPRMALRRSPVSGRSFDHRRGGIEQRLLTLVESFAVGLYAWAVMSNHTQVVLSIDPQLPESWSGEDVARRWARLYRTLHALPDRHIEQRLHRLLDQPERITELSARLGSWVGSCAS